MTKKKKMESNIQIYIGGLIMVTYSTNITCTIPN